MIQPFIFDTMHDQFLPSRAGILSTFAISLSSFKISSKKLSKIGKSFLQGDKKLKAIDIKSKKLTAKQREKAFDIITENAIAYAISSVDPDTIDEVNILNASRMAMQKAITMLKTPFDLILTDCMKMKGYDVPVIDLIHGDALSKNIAAASILAKVSRDHLCYELDKKYPQYNIAKNKGYGTKDHLEALKEYGPVKHLHRFSYAPVKACFIEKVSLF